MAMTSVTAVNVMLTGDLSLQGIGSAALGGAILGGVGAVAPMAGGSLAMKAGFEASSLVAKGIGYGLIGVTSIGVAYAQGHRSAKELLLAGLIGVGAAAAGDALFPTTGMTTFKQAADFAPRTLGGFLRPGPNAANIYWAGLVVAPMVEFGVTFYYDLLTTGLPGSQQGQGGGRPHAY